MNRVVLRLVDANSCIKLCMVVLVVVGALVGVLSFVASFFGYDPEVYFIVWNLHGIPAGIAAIVVCPFLGAVFSFFVGLIACLTLNLGLRVLRGIVINGVWDADPLSSGRRP